MLPHHTSYSSTSVSQFGQGNAIGTNYNQFGLVNVQADNNNVNILGLQGVRLTLPTLTDGPLRA